MVFLFQVRIFFCLISNNTTQQKKHKILVWKMDDWLVLILLLKFRPKKTQKRTNLLCKNRNSSFCSQIVIKTNIESSGGDWLSLLAVKKLTQNKISQPLSHYNKCHADNSHNLEDWTTNEARTLKAQRWANSLSHGWKVFFYWQSTKYQKTEFSFWKEFQFHYHNILLDDRDRMVR